MACKKALLLGSYHDAEEDGEEMPNAKMPPGVQVPFIALLRRPQERDTWIRGCANTFLMILRKSNA